MGLQKNTTRMATEQNQKEGHEMWNSSDQKQA